MDVRASGASRDCWPTHKAEGCEVEELAGATWNYCYCNTDLCNSSTAMVGNYASIMGILVIFYLLK